MKFSIIIPTQDRPNLMALAVHYASSQNYNNIELIVSDNSTTFNLKEENKLKLNSCIQNNKVIYVGPEKTLSAPEHFEYALQHATGDYVLYLTDKMMLLPDTLEIASHVIKKTNAEIVNWTYVSYEAVDYLSPESNGVVNRESPITSGTEYEEYDSIKHLAFKSRGALSRSKESIRDYVKGKICFGFYSKELINRILEKTGSVYGGVTHDYSAMVQGLCLSKKSVILNNPGIIFVGLPLDKSLGSLTRFCSFSAFKYYESFPQPEKTLKSLFVPGLYSSQHNMVVHDYIKYLSVYDKKSLFYDKFWLSSIEEDLYLKGKTWRNEAEKKEQLNLFNSYISKYKWLFFYFLTRKFGKFLLKFKNESMLFIRRSLKILIKLVPFLGKKIIRYRRKFSACENKILPLYEVVEMESKKYLKNEK